MIKYTTIKDKEREFLSITSLTHQEFKVLLPLFTKIYEEDYRSGKTRDGEVRKRNVGGGSKPKLITMEDKLFFILVYNKTYPTQTVLGLQFGMSQGQANVWILRLLPILHAALKELKLSPVREASEFSHDGSSDLLVDGTERKIQRPKNEEKQKEKYSGKKKVHTDKNILIASQATGQIKYLSPTVPGKTHDKKAIDDTGIQFPANTTLIQDTGFQGYKPENVQIIQPKKNKKEKS